MAREVTVKEGAEFNLAPSAYGDEAKRSPWVARIATLTTLAEAVPLLLEWRTDHAGAGITDKDDLWIEAQLETKVAVLRFDSLTNDQIRTETLTNENVTDVCADILRRAEEVGRDVDKLELLVAGFRDRYRPPIMPSSPFMRTETELVEFLMKARELDWYGQSLDELREDRGVVMHKSGSKKERTT
ncbi:MAG TPA: methane monooxygenase [Acidimicrobiia bacterium]|jgi:methane monooxygenase component A gamma chain|nr:methane monooxygenase [Acidimicrobiia bacterium]